MKLFPSFVTARLQGWIAEQKQRATENEERAGRTSYNGTVLAACRVYQEHTLSPFHRVKHNTRRTYLKDLRLVEATVGARLIRNVTILDVQRWYEEWRKPDPERPGRENLSA